VCIHGSLKFMSSYKDQQFNAECNLTEQLMNQLSWLAEEMD
jgi:hypothetical protein